MSAGPPAEPDPARENPLAMVRTRGYLFILLLAALLGVPISAVAFGFLALVHELQELVYHDLPKGLGFEETPDWWAVPLLSVSGVLVALTIRYLPGGGGHKPAEGLKASGGASVSAVPGVTLAAIASLSLGVVLGPEAPLIAIGGGLAVGLIKLLKKDAPASAGDLLGAAGSFAAISALFGSPLLGAFLLMEATGLGGAMLGVVLVPGLLAAGVGSLMFTGLGSWTGLGTFSMSLQHVPQADRPTVAAFGWALLVGVVAAFLGEGIRRASLRLQGVVERRRLILTTLAGALIGVCALVFAAATDKPISDVLYSGESTVGPLLAEHASYSVGVLVLLVVCKSLAYCLSLSAFRGGPVFPAVFIGGAGGIALAHLPGVDTTTGFAMGVGALSVAMLRLPMTCVLLATLLLGSEGITVTPLVIPAVVVAYVVTLWLAPRKEQGSPRLQPAAA
ncbi:chloride channel protein [Streptomyces sp. NPDC057675]|uniref:chloride channel protein n=1 Tax=Streptomyces sp. NPDC057675 TaxID=3346204 RepID=UPI00369766A6